jgi:voltage-gated potassium channel
MTMTRVERWWRRPEVPLVLLVLGFVRIVLSESRLSYVLRHWYDVALVVIPTLRPIRLLRLLAFVRIPNPTVAGSLAGRSTSSPSPCVGLGAVAVLDVDRAVSSPSR